MSCQRQTDAPSDALFAHIPANVNDDLRVPLTPLVWLPKSRRNDERNDERNDQLFQFMPATENAHLILALRPSSWPPPSQLESLPSEIVSRICGHVVPFALDLEFVPVRRRDSPKTRVRPRLVKYNASLRDAIALRGTCQLLRGIVDEVFANETCLRFNGQHEPKTHHLSRDQWNYDGEHLADQTLERMYAAALKIEYVGLSVAVYTRERMIFFPGAPYGDLHTGILWQLTLRRNKMGATTSHLVTRTHKRKDFPQRDEIHHEKLVERVADFAKCRRALVTEPEMPFPLRCVQKLCDVWPDRLRIGKLEHTYAMHRCAALRLYQEWKTEWTKPSEGVLDEMSQEADISFGNNEEFLVTRLEWT